MKTKPRLFALLAALLTHFSATVAAESPDRAIQSVFDELRSLKAMQSGASYTLRAGGTELSGPKETFLRRRTAGEIAESGLSCGCGDYALVFIERIRRSGFEALLVDAAQISSLSLAHTFAGHAVAAVRPKGDAAAPWWLVDPTARKILSRDWSPQAKTFTASGHVYWIGYCGPVEAYPVRTPTELKRFYADTLATAPREFLNGALPRLVFTIDPSLENGNGGYLNPRVTRLQAQQDEIFSKYGITPEHQVPILLTRGGDNASTSLDLVDDRWVAQIGLKSACSPSLLSYFEGKVGPTPPKG